MHTKTYDSFQIEGSKLNVTISVPESMDEYDALAKVSGACLQSGIDNVVYRGVLADFRYYFCEAFEKQITAEYPSASDLKRKTKVVGKKKGTDEERIVFAEGEAEYVRRALPILAGLRKVDEVKVEEFQPLADRILSETEEVVIDGVKTSVPKVSFDPSERERAERGPKALPKTYLKAGEAIVAQGGAAGFMSHYSISLVEPADATEAQIAALQAEAIGWKIKSLEDAERAKTNLADKYSVAA